jgi:hypothetical protein
VEGLFSHRKTAQFHPPKVGLKVTVQFQLFMFGFLKQQQASCQWGD